jgi:hypothetical protein
MESAAAAMASLQATFIRNLPLWQRRGRSTRAEFSW